MFEFSLFASSRNDTLQHSKEDKKRPLHTEEWRGQKEGDICVANSEAVKNNTIGTEDCRGRVVVLLPSIETRLEVQRRLSLDAVRQVAYVALFDTIVDAEGTRSTLPTHTKLQGREPIVSKRAFVSI